MARPSRLEPIQRAPTSLAAFVGPVSSASNLPPTVVRSFPEFQTTFGGPVADRPLDSVVAGFFRNGGREALICPTTQSSWSTDEARLIDYRHAFNVLEECATFNLLIVPPPDWSGWMCSAVAPIHLAAADACRRVRAMLLLDPPIDFDALATPTIELGYPRLLRRTSRSSILRSWSLTGCRPGTRSALCLQAPWPV